MGVTRKLTMASVALRLGRQLRDKGTLLRLCASYGGLGSFRGGVLEILTNCSAAPVLYLRDTAADTILMVEVLMEQDYRCLRLLHFVPQQILDIGANIGLGSFYLKSLFPEAGITGFEPSPEEREILSRNYDAWGDCQALPYAVGDVDDVEIRFAVHPERTGGQHVLKNETLGDWHEIHCRQRRIDCLIEQGSIPVPDLVKMDIEGAEVEALRSFGSYLPKVGAFVLETHSPSLHQACLEILVSSGHRVLSDVARSSDARILLTERQV